MSEYNSVKTSGIFTFSLGDIGFITWLVFLILKLCNKDNPNFEWLTWFWVWFPFWIPWAIGAALFIIIIAITLILVAIDN